MNETLEQIARAMASGTGSIAISGHATNASIRTILINGDTGLRLGADALEAVRAILLRELPRPRHNLREVDHAFAIGFYQQALGIYEAIEDPDAERVREW